MNPTPEQQAIISSIGNIKINAVAGSGKTTTLIEYARTRPSGSFCAARATLRQALNRSLWFMRHCLYATVVLLLMTACTPERGTNDNDLGNMHHLIPAFVSAVRQNGTPGLTLEHYQEVWKQMEGDSYSDSATRQSFREYQEMVPRMNNDMQSYLAMAPPLAWWDTVTHHHRSGLRYLEALMVFPSELAENGAPVRRSFMARFVVLQGKVWFYDKMYDLPVREFYDRAVETLFTDRLRKFPNLYEQKIGTQRDSQRKKLSYDRGAQLHVTDLPNVYRLTSSDMQDTLALVSGYPEVRVDNGRIRTIRNDTTFILSFTGKVLLKTHHAVHFHHAQDYFLLMDVNTRLFGLYDNLTGLYIEPQYRWIDFFEREEAPYAGVITADGEVAYLDMDGNRMP